MAGVGTAVAATAAAGSAAGLGVFGYNRGNYQMDAKNRYTRYTAGLNMAIAQMGMYKQDISDMTQLTVNRQDVYHSVAAMGLTILTAIYCPGRVGLHTPAPPGWLMGLAFLNIAGTYMFLLLTLWFCIHAAFRADTAGTSMLTRFCRLPIPSQGMLDKARKFGSSFEEVPLNEAFRIPFTQHPNAEGERLNEDMKIDNDAALRARRSADVPTWYRIEKSVGKRNTVETIKSAMPLEGRGKDTPEHFEAYRELQYEWFSYDVYARISIFLAFMHMIHCWAYLQIGHQMQETRALFACGLVMLSMFTLQQIVLILDIVPRGFPWEKLGPFGLWCAYIASAIEYRRWYNADVQFIGFVFVWLAHALHIIYTLQLIRLCAPNREAPAVAEMPGGSWWPSEWALPSAFQHVCWLVAPPKELEANQVDIVGELRAAQGASGSGSGGGGSKADAKRADAHAGLGPDGESRGWWNVRIGLVSMLIGWIWLTAGFSYEVWTQGTTKPALLNAPGMPHNSRDPRYRPMKVGAHEPTEVGTGGIHHGPARGVHMESMHRRLSGVSTRDLVSQPIDNEALEQALTKLMPHLKDLANAAAYAPADTLDQGAQPVRAPVTWPAFFEPQFMACGAHTPEVLALSRHGRGSLINMHGGHDAARTPENFVLDGVVGHGPLVAASWDGEGLLLVSNTGATLECAGARPTEGRWECKQIEGARLPISSNGRMLSSHVAISRGTKGLRAAVHFQGDSTMTLFSRMHRSSAPWLPAGDISTPSKAMMAPAFSAGADGLLMTGTDGSVSHVHMGTGRSSTVAAAPTLDRHAAYPAACRLSSGDLVRLALGDEAEVFMG